MFQLSSSPLGLCAAPVPSRPLARRRAVFIYHRHSCHLNWNLSTDAAPPPSISCLATVLFNICVISMEIPVHSRKSKPCSVIRTVARRRSVSLSGVAAAGDEADPGLKEFLRYTPLQTRWAASRCKQQSSLIYFFSKQSLPRGTWINMQMNTL